MTKETIIKMRKDFSKSPIRIVCDNMLIVWENSKNYPNCIWDDDAQILTVFRANTQDIQQGYPFEIFIIEYDSIQSMEVLVTPKDAVEFLQQHKSAMGDSFEMAMDLVSETISQRGYTGTVSMPNVQK